MQKEEIGRIQPVKQSYKFWIIWIFILSIAIIVLILFIILYPNKPVQRVLNVDNNIKDAIVYNEDLCKINLNSINLSKISSLSFIFRNGKEYRYYADEIRESYNVLAKDLGLKNFKGIKSVEAIIVYDNTANTNAFISSDLSNCTDNCSGKQCGDDGCGGSCGTCGTGYFCNSSQQCVKLAVYYISTTGDDNNSGTIDEPFLSLEKARDTIQSTKPLTQPITVYLRGGTYNIDKPFTLSDRDSGTEEFPITYASFPGENVLISGGKKLTSAWSEYNHNGNTIYVADVGSLNFNTLFVNGKRAIRARSPNHGQPLYASIIPLYRFWKSDTGSHFYTPTESEKNSLKQYPVLNLEGIEGYVYKGPDAQSITIDEYYADTIPIYRFWNNGQGVHYYTKNESEKIELQSNVSWSFEGIAFYIYPSQKADAVPFYKFYNPSTQDCFYTTNDTEKNSLISNHPEVIYGGIEGYIFPKNSGLDSEAQKQDIYQAFYFRKGDINPSWGNDVEIVSFQRWVQSRLRISRIVGNKVYFDSKPENYYGWDYGGFNRYYVENIFEGLDSPGEWFLDKDQGKLYYYPTPEENIGESEFIVPVLDQLVTVGDYDKIKEFASGDYLSFTDDTSLDFGNSEFTISVWLNFPEGEISPSWSLSKGYPLNSKGYGISHVSNSDPVSPVEFIVNDGNTIIHSNAGNLQRNTWGHFVWSVDRTNKVINAYKNGVKVGETNISSLGDISVPGLPVMIGKMAEFDFFTGNIDEFKIYKRALNQDEIQSLYERNYANSNDLVMSLSFENNYLDSSGSGNSGLAWGNPKFSIGSFGTGLSFTAREEYYNDFDGYVQYVNFKGLDFSYTDWKLPKEGYIGSQTGFRSSKPAVMLITLNSSFENNKISHVGGYGLSSYSKNLLINRNEITDTGAGGIRVGEPTNNFFVTLANFKMVNNLFGYNLIKNNMIHNTGAVFKDAVGISIYGNSNNHIRNNLIYNTTYSGISLGWFSMLSMGDIFGNNRIEKNEIHNVMTELNDGAGIYIMGKQKGSIITNNVIHDVLKTGNHLFDIYFWGIYTEGGTADLLIENNIVYRTGWGGLMFFTNLKGTNNNNNIAKNNIFVDGANYQTFFERSGGDTFKNNIIYYNRNSGKLFYILDTNAINYSDYNLFYSPNNLNNLNSQLDTWKSYGFDSNSIVADPLFADYSNDNFTLLPNSPAFDFGFKQIDVSDVGPESF